jgi:hypothetical protein
MQQQEVQACQVRHSSSISSSQARQIQQQA